MSDVAQILGLGAASSSAGNAGSNAVAKELENLKPSGPSSTSHVPGMPLKSKSKKPKKLSGMEREVVELLENHHRVSHALYPGFSKTSLQQKWRERKDRPAVPWVRQAFRNIARSGLPGEDVGNEQGLTLSHWTKAHAMQPAEYVFAKFNVVCDVFQYSDEEYARAVEPHVDPAMVWTKDETDELFRLCRKHDLRWIVIADRFNSANSLQDKEKKEGKEPSVRSVEDIKYRYYEVVRLVSEDRDRRAHQEQVERLQKLHAETESHVKVETATASTPVPAEAATTEANANAASSEAGATATASAEVKPTSAATETSNAAPSLTPTPTAVPAPAPALASASAAAQVSALALPPPPNRHYFRFQLGYERRRKHQLDLAFSRTVDDENEIRRLQDDLKAVEQQLKRVSVKVDAKKKKELADAPFRLQRHWPQGVMLRSAMQNLPPQKHNTLSVKMVKKMELMLDELGVPLRPMPSQAVNELFDTLRQDIVGLLSLRKHLAAKRTEMQTMQARYQTLTGTAYKPITTPLPKRKPAPRPRTTNATGSSSKTANTNAAQPAHAGKGKALHHAPGKASRVSNKRRGSGASSGVPSKRSRKAV